MGDTAEFFAGKKK